MGRERTYAVPREAAKILGCSEHMIRVSLRQRAPGWENLVYYECGREIHIPWDSLDAFASGRVTAPVPARPAAPVAAVTAVKAKAVCRKVRRR